MAQHEQKKTKESEQVSLSHVSYQLPKSKRAEPKQVIAERKVESTQKKELIKTIMLSVVIFGILVGMWYFKFRE